MDHMLGRWPSFAHFFDDRRVCMTNDASEQALPGLALGREAWHLAGSDRGGQQATSFAGLVETVKLNDVGPQARLIDVLGPIAPYPAQHLAELLTWNWRPIQTAPASLDAAA